MSLKNFGIDDGIFVQWRWAQEVMEPDAVGNHRCMCNLPSRITCANTTSSKITSYQIARPHTTPQHIAASYHTTTPHHTKSLRSVCANNCHSPRKEKGLFGLPIPPILPHPCILSSILPFIFSSILHYSSLYSLFPLIPASLPHFIRSSLHPFIHFPPHPIIQSSHPFIPAPIHPFLPSSFFFTQPFLDPPLHPFSLCFLLPFIAGRVQSWPGGLREAIK